MDAYTDDVLIGKYPEIEQHIRLKYFRILKGENGRPSILFSNTTIFAPTQKFISRVADELFDFPSPDRLVFKVWGLMGIEVCCVEKA